MWGNNWVLEDFDEAMLEVAHEVNNGSSQVYGLCTSKSTCLVPSNPNQVYDMISY